MLHAGDMKRIIFAAVLAAVTASAAPARADSTYYLVEGYGYPRAVVAGPFDGMSACLKAERFYSTESGRYDFHCDIGP